MQSNGEIDITALETAYEGITLQFIVRKDLKAEGVFDKTKRKGGNAFSWPIIENSTHWMIVGLNYDLFEAMKLASRNAIDFLVRMQGLSPEESYQFLSMVGDFEIAEAVNVIKNVTVHIRWLDLGRFTAKLMSLFLFMSIAVAFSFYNFISTEADILPV